ncbi:proteasome activator complex subunit 3-like isoform X1 [Pomacea canaliculata]|uniref:proteasome activator complex subunit 3-like isoform X1 n=1 Tax=Pomacea canaliculata TaxID=400727 RepID=UPI000D73E256|nr:proteasome activator complex subunit 3-like isoform X1 [Pomacea canaliculata]
MATTAHKQARKLVTVCSFPTGQSFGCPDEAFRQEPDQVTKKVSEFIENFKKETEALVTNIFPQKVLDIEEVYRKMIAEKISAVHEGINIPVPEPIVSDGDEPSTKKRRLENNHSGALEISGTPVLVFPEGKVSYNHRIHNWAESIKPLIMDLMEHANMVKMWISFLIPKIEDGNNFGVSIQEDTMAEARQVETESATYLDQLSRYYVTRAKIITKIAKYPHVEDYRQAVRELDEKQIVCLRLTLCEMRNHYASLHDIIHKNMDKIKKPRSGNAENLY